MALALFFAIYSISSIVSNALYSVTTLVLILCTIYMYRKSGVQKIVLPDKKFNIMYWPFFGLIILASALLGDISSVEKALDYLYWSAVPFVLYFFALQKKCYEKVVVSALSCGVLTLCSYALYQCFLLPDGMRIQSYLSHPNYLAEMLILSLPFLIIYAFKNKKVDVRIRILSGVTAGIGCIVLALTASRGGILGFLIGALLFSGIRFFYVRRVKISHYIRMVLIILVIAAAIAGTFQMTFGDTGAKAFRPYDQERVLMLESSYHMWQDHKLIGVGLKNWHEEYLQHYISPEAKEPNLVYPHNTFAYFFSLTGIVGGCGYLLFTFGMFIYLCRKLKKNPHNLFLNALLWAFLAIMLHGLVNAAILSKFVMRFYSTVLGIGLASVAYDENREQPDMIDMEEENSYENL
jgi:hypothetical protein